MLIQSPKNPISTHLAGCDPSRAGVHFIGLSTQTHTFRGPQVSAPLTPGSPCHPGGVCGPSRLSGRSSPPLPPVDSQGGSWGVGWGWGWAPWDGWSPLQSQNQNNTLTMKSNNNMRSFPSPHPGLPHIFKGTADSHRPEPESAASPAGLDSSATSFFTETTCNTEPRSIAINNSHINN